MPSAKSKQAQVVVRACERVIDCFDHVENDAADFAVRVRRDPGFAGDVAVIVGNWGVLSDYVVRIRDSAKHGDLRRAFQVASALKGSRELEITIKSMQVFVEACDKGEYETGLFDRTRVKAVRTYVADALVELSDFAASFE